MAGSVESAVLAGQAASMPPAAPTGWASAVQAAEEAKVALAATVLPQAGAAALSASAVAGAVLSVWVVRLRAALSVWVVRLRAARPWAALP